MVTRSFYQAHLSGQDFSGQDLRGADFTLSEAEGTNFSGANLQGAKFRFANIRGADFRGANIERVNFDKSNMEGALFDEVKEPPSKEVSSCSLCDTDTPVNYMKSGLCEECFSLTLGEKDVATTKSIGPVRRNLGPILMVVASVGLVIELIWWLTL